MDPVGRPIFAQGALVAMVAPWAGRDVRLTIGARSRWKRVSWQGKETRPLALLTVCLLIADQPHRDRSGASRKSMRITYRYPNPARALDAKQAPMPCPLSPGKDYDPAT